MAGSRATIGLTFLLFLALGPCALQARYTAHPALVVRTTVPTASTTSYLPLASGNQTLIASATSAVHALSSAVATYAQTPSKDNAQDTKDRADDAKKAALAVGTTYAGFAALIPALDAMVTAAEAAVSNPGAETASDLQTKEKDVDDAEDEIDKEESTTTTQKSSATSTTASSSIKWTSAGPNSGCLLGTSKDSTAASSMAVSVLWNLEDIMECMTTATLPFPTACPKPTCSEGNNSKMGVNNEPASWCFCGSRGPYATKSGATTNYCDFTAYPHTTISLTSHSTSIDTRCTPTSVVTAQSTNSFCQCGQVIAGIQTATSTKASTTYKYGYCAMSPAQTFTTVTETPTPTHTPLCGNYMDSFGSPTWNNEPLGFPRDTGNDAIQKFCGKQVGNGQKAPGAYDYYVSPDSLWTGHERFWYDNSGNYCGAQTGPNGGTGYWPKADKCTSPSVTGQFIVIWFQYSANQTGCKAKGKWTMPKGDSCVDALQPLLDSCDTGTPSDPMTWKHGGVIRLNTGGGCFDLQLGALSQGSYTNSKKLPSGKPDETEQLNLS